jgi:predicted RecA/RadA family phage recombinase
MKNYSYDGVTINITNTSGAPMLAGKVYLVGNGWYCSPVKDIPDDGVGACLQAGVIKLPVPSGTTLAPGADYEMILATQLYDASTGVTVGRVMSQTGLTAEVLLNSVPGGVK